MGPGALQRRSRQVLASKPRSLGKSAAEGSNDRLQADRWTSPEHEGRHKFGLVVTGVFTREVATKPAAAETGRRMGDHVDEATEAYNRPY